MIFGGIKKGKESNEYFSENFHGSRIILKLIPETSLRDELVGSMRISC